MSFFFVDKDGGGGKDDDDNNNVVIILAILAVTAALVATVFLCLYVRYCCLNFIQYVHSLIYVKLKNKHDCIKFNTLCFCILTGHHVCVMIACIVQVVLILLRLFNLTMSVVVQIPCLSEPDWQVCPL